MKSEKLNEQLIDLISTFAGQMRRRMAGNMRNGRYNWLQIHVLCFVDEAKGITMSELAKMLMVTAPTATAFVNRLVRKGLVRRVADPHNRKLVRIELTPTGHKLFSAMMREKRLIFARMIKMIPLRDRSTLIDILKPLVDSFSRFKP